MAWKTEAETRMQAHLLLSHVVGLSALGWRASAEASVQVGEVVWVPLCFHLVQAEVEKLLEQWEIT